MKTTPLALTLGVLFLSTVLVSGSMVTLGSDTVCSGGESEILFRMDGQSAGGLLGASVAGIADVNGDGVPDFLIGAPETDVGGTIQVGRVNVVSGSDASLIMTLTGQSQEFFGYSVASAGDLDGDGTPDFLVGAPLATYSGINDSGSAYAFSGATGNQIYRFDGATIYGQLGSSVANAGDVDNDGVPDILVGAPEPPNTGWGYASYGPGAAFVFSGATGAQLHRFDGQLIDDEFGASVAGVGDVDGDGIADLMVGAPVEAAPGVSSYGVVSVFSGATGVVIHSLFGTSLSRCGDSVACVGDVDGDGVPDLLVGAPDTGRGLAYAAGAALLFSGASGLEILRLDGLEGASFLGRSVAGLEDVDSDGVPDLLIGSHYPDSRSGVYRAGSAFVYSGATGALLNRFDGLDAEGYLGTSVSSAGDLNGDGIPEILTGAPGVFAPFGIGLEGSVFCYSISTFLSADTSTLSASTGGLVNFNIDFPDSEAGMEYSLRGSITGTGPIEQNGVCIPITPDALTSRMITNPPAVFQQITGTLGPGGTANAWIDVPPANPALLSIVGTRAHFVAVSLDAGGVRAASVAVPVDIVP